jgi:drug/metabolite transporter superfamily protein YnfA
MQAETQAKPSKWLLAPLSFGAAALLDVVVTVEWSSPYCNRQDDGPGWAIYGVIPYERFSGVSSMVYDFQPASFAANLALLWVLCGAVALALYVWTPLFARPDRARRVAAVGMVAAALMGAYYVALYSLGWWIPVPSLTDSRYDTQIRPVGLSVGDRAYECTPSQFWFGPVSPDARAAHCARRAAGCP